MQILFEDHLFNC